MGKEDDLFYEDPQFTHWRQVTEQYSPFQMSMLYHPMTNIGVGNRMCTDLTKSPDFLWRTYWFGFYPGLKPNQDKGVSQTSYVNAVSFYIIKQLVMKIGTHTLFDITGQMMLVMCELTGLLNDLAELIGNIYIRVFFSLKMDKTKVTTLQRIN